MTAPFKLTSIVPLERQEQEALFKWAAVMAKSDLRFHLLFAIPNGTAASSIREAALAKRMGRKRGVPDIFFPVPMMHEVKQEDGSIFYSRFSGLFIELKRENGKPNDVSAEQRKWLLELNNQGYKAIVAYGWRMAADAIIEYLQVNPSLDSELL